MTDCLNHKQILNLLAGGHPTGPEWRAHVDGCSECQRRVAEVLGVFRFAGQMEAFQSGARENVPPDVSQRLRAYVQDLYQEHIGQPSCHGEFPDRSANGAFEDVNAQLQGYVVFNADCPSSDRLISLLAGEEDPGVRDHVHQCRRCSTAVAKLHGMFRLAAATEKFSSDFFRDESESIPDSVNTRMVAHLEAVRRQQHDRHEPCPDRDRIVASIAGSEDAPEVRSHIQECDVCRQTVARLLGVLRYCGSLFALDSDVSPADHDAEKMARDADERIFASANRAFEDRFGTVSPESVSVTSAVAGPETRDMVQRTALLDARKTRFLQRVRPLISYASAASLLMAGAIQFSFCFFASQVRSTPMAVRQGEGESLSNSRPKAREDAEAGGAAVDESPSETRLSADGQPPAESRRTTKVQIQEWAQSMMTDPELEQYLAQFRRDVESTPELPPGYEDLETRCTRKTECEAHEDMILAIAVLDGYLSRGGPAMVNALQDTIDTESTHPTGQRARALLLGQGIHKPIGRDNAMSIVRMLASSFTDLSIGSASQDDATSNRPSTADRLVMNSAINGETSAKSPMQWPAPAQRGFAGTPRKAVNAVPSCTIRHRERRDSWL